MEFHLRSGGMEVLYYTASSMNSSSTAGNRTSYCKIFETQSSSPCARTREKDLTVPTIGGSPFCPLLVKSSAAAQQACTIHRRRTSPIESMWLQSQQRHNGHGVHSPSTPEEVPWTKQGSVCNICCPDTVSRKGPWRILRRLGCPGKFPNMVLQLHEDQRS